MLIDFHYCGGELAFVSLYQADEDGCCGEHESEKKNCCEDKFVFVDTDDTEASKTFVVKNIDLKSFTLPVYHVVKTNRYFVNSQNLIPLDHAPPNSGTTDLYIKNRILLI